MLFRYILSGCLELCWLHIFFVLGLKLAVCKGPIVLHIRGLVIPSTFNVFLYILCFKCFSGVMLVLNIFCFGVKYSSLQRKLMLVYLKKPDLLFA